MVETDLILLNRFVGFLERRAGRSGGISVQRIRQLAKEFATAADATRPSFDYEAVGGRRRDLLGRLVVEKFAHLFVENGGPPLAKGGLSRSVLPGFFMVLRLALGEDLLNTCQRKCDHIVARLQGEKGDAFGWEDYFADVEARELVLEIIATLASFFDDFAKRRDWFIGIINSSLARGESAGQPWQFSQHHFDALMCSLFSEFRDHLGCEAGHTDFVGKFGEAPCERLDHFLDRLPWSAHKPVPQTAMAQ